METTRNLATGAVVFALENTEEVMNHFGIKTWAFGGSVAGAMYGIDFGRVLHDIDIIVPPGTIAEVKKQLEDDLFFDTCIETSSVDEEFETVHLGFRAIKGLPFDLIESPDVCTTQKDVQHRMSLKHLVLAKSKYHRHKDQRDLELLMEAYFKQEGK